MSRLSMIAGIILVLITGFCVQLLFVFASTEDTPNKAVVEFSKAYFQLDRSMAERICHEQLTSDDVDVVDQYFYRVAREAKDRGFDIDFMKNKLYHIETTTLKKGDNEAQVRITGKRRISINPVYVIVANVFNLSETYEVDATFDVVREDGKWKVCGNLSSLPAI